MIIELFFCDLEIFFLYLYFDLKIIIFVLVFTHDFPARSCFQVGKLPMGSTVEIECIALTNDVKTVST